MTRLVFTTVLFVSVLLASCSRAMTSVPVVLRLSLASPDHLEEYERFATPNPSLPFLWLNPDVVISNADVKSATTVRTRDHWGIKIQLTREASERFGTFTGQNVGKTVGIVLNTTMASCDEIKEPIQDGHFIITGAFTRETAEHLALGILQ